MENTGIAVQFDGNGRAFRAQSSTICRYSPLQYRCVAVELTPVFVGSILVVVFLAGVVNGVAGFGFALVGTMALASAIDPTTAVVFMIVPILAVNLSLVRELSASELRTCGRRFGPLLVSALVGTILGLVVLDSLPEAPLKIGLGILSLGFVATNQGVVTVPGLERAKEWCFVETTPAMVGIGVFSGLVFGGTNVGVQLVAYFRGRDLPHGLFVGVVAMVFLGLNGVRIGAAGILGLYPSTAILFGSLAAAVPAAVGVTLGKRIRSTIRAHHRRGAVLGLLTLVGIRLLLAGTGVA